MQKKLYYVKGTDMDNFSSAKRAERKKVACFVIE